MKTKPWRNVISGGVLAGLVLAGAWWVCGCGDVVQPDVTRLRWVTDPNPARDRQLGLFRETHPLIEIFLDGTSRGMTKVLVQMAAHAGPDLLDCYQQADLRQFAHYKALLPITEMCHEAGISMDMFWPQVRYWTTYKEKIYGIPTNAGTFVLFYNKDHFDEVGLAYPDDSWTWDDYLAAAKKLTIHKGPNRRFGAYLGYPWHWFWQAGAEVWSEDMSRCTLDSPEAIRTFTFLYNLRHKYHVVPSPADEQSFAAGGWGGGSINLFATGRVSMLDMGRWGVITFRKHQRDQRERGEKPLRFGVAHLPRDRQRGTTFLSRGTCINAESAHPREAFEFLKFLTSPEYNQVIAEGGDGFPAVKELARSDLFLYDENYPEEDNNEVYIESVEYARVPRISPDIIPAEYDNLVQDYFDHLATGKIPPDELAREMTAEINEAMDRYRERNKDRN